MDEHTPAAAELQKKIHENGGQPANITTIADELIGRDIQEYGTHGFGGERDENDQSYAINRTNDGDLIIQISNTISVDGFTKALGEANAFAEEIEGKDDDPGMLATAWDDLEPEAAVRSAGKSMKPPELTSRHGGEHGEAGKNALSIAKDRTDWDRVDHENEMRAMDEEHSPDLRAPRARKFARQAWRLLTHRR